MQLPLALKGDVRPAQTLDLVPGKSLLPGEAEDDLLCCALAGFQQPFHGGLIYFWLLSFTMARSLHSADGSKGVNVRLYAI